MNWAQNLEPAMYLLSWLLYSYLLGLCLEASVTFYDNTVIRWYASTFANEANDSAFGKAGDGTEVALGKCTRSIIVKECQATCGPAGIGKCYVHLRTKRKRTNNNAEVGIDYIIWCMLSQVYMALYCWNCNSSIEARGSSSFLHRN